MLIYRHLTIRLVSLQHRIRTVSHFHYQLLYTANVIKIFYISSNSLTILSSCFLLQNAIWSVVRPAPDVPSSPKRAGEADSELPIRKKKTNNFYLRADGTDGNIYCK